MTKSTTEIAKECGAYTGNSPSHRVKQATIDAVNAQNSEPVYQVGINEVWFDSTEEDYIKVNPLIDNRLISRRVIYLAPQPSPEMAEYVEKLESHIMHTQDFMAMLRKKCTNVRSEAFDKNYKASVSALESKPSHTTIATSTCG